jgi:hypothetical protein
MQNVLFPLLQSHKLNYVCKHVVVVEFVVSDECFFFQTLLTMQKPCNY